MAQSNRGRSASQLSVLIQSGVLDPVTLTEETFAAIRASADQSIFVSLLEERALLEASASARRIQEGRSLGLLDGIPVAWKDLFDIEGIATTAGSAILKTAEPAVCDADVVKALAGAGMVSIGRVNMSEFAFSGLGINPHYGTPENPASTDGARLPGGSSSGSGVVVAAGLVPVSIGSDTGGSVRIPAAFNGVVGYKATRGRYSMRGVFPLSKSLDSLGPLCRTVQDAVWIDAAMRGLSAPDIRRGSVEGLSLVVPETIVFDDAEEGVISAFEAALKRLEKSGAKIRRRAFPTYAGIFELMAKNGPLVTAEAFATHRERLAGPQAQGMDPRVVARARLGEKITVTDYIETIAARERLKMEFASSIEPGELVVSPTLPHVAPLTAPLLGDDELFVKTNAKTLRNTLIINFLDGCGVSIPCGTGDACMPVGFLISGLPNADEHLLSVALAAEESLG
ncbi:amidase [Agrobacterium fabrum]|uniref:amidase n=1 Tax=Agrobacterium fabrum TaxID=1176649 RepID=UPI000EF58905|nr:amidase [Agrobacterium fabrum]AYM64987.1 aspartyl-tRNA(Asn)/glutamyl-tRNA(Gln) amidotransferase subunit A [Agrobacterium fabrum]NTE62809.1 amidase [Agrobacterium fabrum]